MSKNNKKVSKNAFFKGFVAVKVETREISKSEHGLDIHTPGANESTESNPNKSFDLSIATSFTTAVNCKAVFTVTSI